MNVKELIEKYEYLNHDCFRRVDTSEVLKDLKQLDEPQPVKVPQFVADWIEYCKRGLSIRQAISQVHVGIEVDDWLMEVDADGAFVNQDLFARAWLDGYEVEKEKRYFVKIRATKHCFVKDGNGKIFFSLAYKGCFTKKELEESGFGWVFECPGIEIKEVEE
nr:MAG TPA: Protein of unknown function (DUF1642) [Caudoviricetes sp.]